jgi:hypothetical protein
VFAHGWLSPDGYTILPMRRPTTRIAAIFIMAAIDKQKCQPRQRLSRKQPSQAQNGTISPKHKKQLIKSLPIILLILGQRFRIAEQ